jgi:Ser/Thr protein kinase RdoA (MazF antagonist)
MTCTLHVAYGHSGTDTWANPKHPLSPSSAEALGRALARMHSAADDFTSIHRRSPLDLDHLIQEPLRRAQSFVAHRPDEWTYLVRLGETLSERIAALASAGLDWGPCHGDATERNAHLADDGAATLYDFDSGGPGWRAYDLATFLMEARKHA